MIFAAAILAPLAAFALLVAAALIDQGRDDRKDGMTPGPRHPVTAQVTRAARHVISAACRPPRTTDIPGLRAQLIARGAFEEPPAAGVGHEQHQPAAGVSVPGRDSPGTSPDVTGENAPAAPHSAAAGPPAGDLSQAIAAAGELLTHAPGVWEGHRNIAPWFDPGSPWADEPGAFTAFASGSGEVA